MDKFDLAYSKEQGEQEAPKKPKNNSTLWQAVKFTLFSLSAGIIQVLSFTILNDWVIQDTGHKYGWSYFIALTLSVLWNFTFNRKFTFKAANNVPIAMLKVLCYYIVFTPLSIWWGEALEGAGWNEYLVLAITMIINFITEFLYSKFFVFKEDKVSNKTSKKEKQSQEQQKTKE